MLVARQLKRHGIRTGGLLLRQAAQGCAGASPAPSGSPSAHIDRIWEGASVLAAGVAGRRLEGAGIAGRRWMSLRKTVLLDSVEDRMRWGFDKSGAALRRHKAGTGANPGTLAWVSQNTLNVLRMEKADLEEGANMAYRHIASLYEENSPEEWRNQHRSVISPDLAEQFAAQASMYNMKGWTPTLRVDDVEGTLVFCTMLPDGLEVDFNDTSYQESPLPFPDLRKKIGLFFSLVRATYKAVSQSSFANSDMCVSLMIHVHGTEHWSLTEGGSDGEGTLEEDEGRRFDHLMMFEARFKYEDFITSQQVPVTVAGPEGEQAAANARMRLREMEPPITWTLVDFNQHLVRMGKRNDFGLKTPGESES